MTKRPSTPSSSFSGTFYSKLNRWKKELQINLKKNVFEYNGF